MLIVKILLKESFRNGVSIGLGIFANEFIPAGTVVYKDCSEFSRIFTTEEVNTLPQIKQDWLHKYATYKKNDDTWYLCTDEAKYWNHDNNPNCKYESNLNDNKEAHMIAIRDIQIGEELTSDYKEFCDFCKDGNFGFDVI